MNTFPETIQKLKICLIPGHIEALKYVLQDNMGLYGIVDAIHNFRKIFYFCITFIFFNLLLLSYQPWSYILIIIFCVSSLFLILCIMRVSEYLKWLYYGYESWKHIYENEKVSTQKNLVYLQSILHFCQQIHLKWIKKKAIINECLIKAHCLIKKLKICLIPGHIETIELCLQSNMALYGYAARLHFFRNILYPFIIAIITILLLLYYRSSNLLIFPFCLISLFLILIVINMKENLDMLYYGYSNWKHIYEFNAGESAAKDKVSDCTNEKKKNINSDVLYPNLDCRDPDKYFNHPVHGNWQVDTFAKCMEVYGLLRAKKDILAESWWERAIKMSDAPKQE